MSDTLYIIGNGFDLHHEIRTSYANFRDDYVKKKRQGLWKSLLDIYGDAPNYDQWWWHFEEMLGKIDYINLMNSNNGNGMALSSTKVKNFLKNNIPVLFGDWMKTVNDNVKYREYLNIDKDSLFFTFNYTLILEKAYLVNTNNVWHIHGCIRKPDELIIGHDFDNSQIFKLFREYRDKNPTVIQEIAYQINLSAVSGAKKVKERIAQNDILFSQYVNIKHFVAMGFSFNDIDMPYIEKIISVNKNIADTDWTLYWHTDGEFSVMKEKLQKLGVKEGMIHPVKW